MMRSDIFNIDVAVTATATPGKMPGFYIPSFQSSFYRDGDIHTTGAFIYLDSASSGSVVIKLEWPDMSNGALITLRPGDGVRRDFAGVKIVEVTASGTYRFQYGAGDFSLSNSGAQASGGGGGTGTYDAAMSANLSTIAANSADIKTLITPVIGSDGVVLYPQNNDMTYAYNSDGTLNHMQFSQGGNNYRATASWSAGYMVGFSKWVKQ